MAQPGQRTTAQHPQHVGVAPLGPRPGRPELALEDAAAGTEAGERLLADGDTEAEPCGHLGGGERAVRAGVAADEIAERVLDRLGERVRHPGRHGGAEPVAQPRDVLDDGEPVVTAHQDGHHPAGLHQQRDPVVHLAGRLAAGPDLVGGQRAEQAEQVGDALAVAHLPVVGQPLELGLDLGQHVGIEQLAQLGTPEQLGQQALVEGECRGATLGDRRVALVHEGRDVPEQQRLGERRGPLGRDVDQPQASIADLPVQGDQRGQVVDVLEHLAHGLQHDRERGVAHGHLEQLGTALALLPQRRPPAGVAAGEQQGAGGALAEPGGEQGRPADLGGHDLLELVGLEGDQLGAGRVLVGLGDPQHDAVVGGHRLGVHPVALAQPRVDGERPGRVHRRAVRRVHHQPPVAELVTEPLDHDLLVVGDDAGDLALLLDRGRRGCRRPSRRARRRWRDGSPARAASRRSRG